MPAPIVTAGNPAVGFDPTFANIVNTAGAIGQPGTQVLLGNGAISFPGASGLRVTLGGWCDTEQRLGIEGGGFVLQQVANRFSAASNEAGTPALYFPIFSEIAGAERGIPIADPLRMFSGSVTAVSSLQFWGAEGNVLCAIYRRPDMTFAMLAGVRTLSLQEQFQLQNTTRDLLFGNVVVLNDSFRTSNQFYGGQLGARLNLQRGRLGLDVAVKLAVGSAQQVVDIAGNITQLGPNALVPPGPGAFPGGLFAQPSNIGRLNPNTVTVPFMFVPALECKLAYQVTPHFRITAGYDLLHWTDVVRPGKQITHNVNLTQNAVLDPNGVGTLIGPAQPGPTFLRSDFWAQGMTFGLELSF
jgi:hypothetical protein